MSLKRNGSVSTEAKLEKCDGGDVMRSIKWMGAAVAVLAMALPAQAHHRRGCGGCETASCAAVAGCAPTCEVVKKKVMVTEWLPEEYEATRTVYKTDYKDEKYTAHKTDWINEERTRKVTTYKNVPETKDVVVSRWECVPTEEERTITRCVKKTIQVTEKVKRTVDKGGHYECREVLCRQRHSCFLHRHDCGCDACQAEACAPATRTVQVYVPNCVTEEVPVTYNKCVWEPVTEKVKCTVYKRVEKKETVKVTTCKCVAETHDEKYTVKVPKTTSYEATRKVAVCTPVTEKYKATRMVPKQVEREVTCRVYQGCDSCGRERCTHRHFLRCGGCCD